MSVYKIPFTNNNQRFTISIGGTRYTITANWNGEIPAWTINLIVTATQEEIIINLPLLTGANILEQYTYTGLTGFLVAYTNGHPTQPPTFETLGNDSNVYYITGDV